ncbi:MAG: ATP-dependent RNA helicase HrpA [Planctomycetota bacterium]|nr:ATP-dependent RNA helicase HrpA [Planctomycetota bacterium]
MPTLDELDARVAEAMPGDRHRLRAKLRSMRQAAKAGKPFDKNLIRLGRELNRSAELFAARVRGVPTVTFAGDLPIHDRVAEIGDLIRENPVLIVCGETGSGKSTQLPKICLSIGRGVGGTIGHTQPRRIAARSVAARVAEELKVSVGKQVGFKVRFADATEPTTYVKLMTDGILLAETQGDRFLSAYDTIIVDEAHERSLNIDLLLGSLKRLLPRRPDLRVIVTSATIDVERYSEFFAVNGKPAPVVSVEGRTYPVEVRYRPPEASDDGETESDPMRNLVSAVEDICREGRGDALVFVSTERDIREVTKFLRSRPLPGDYSGMASELLPLYGRLSAAEQARVFEAHPHRRIVIATNVAESSITVPNIRYVVDSGTARISRYSARSGVQRLPIEPVSKASADQRKGRCGRVGPGVCIRLYSEADYESRDQYTAPEIQRTNLAAVILQLKALGLGEVEDFPFLDPPKPATIKDGYDTLFELGAIDEERSLTPIGGTLAKLPVDPRVGRMILAANDEGCLQEVLIIAAVLELQDPRERPLEKQQAADEAHKKFADGESDFIGCLRMWRFIRGLKEDLSRGKLRRACQKNFLSYNRVREWEDIHRQLMQLAEQAGFDPRRNQGLLNALAEEGQAKESIGHVAGIAAAKRRETTSAEAYGALHRALLAGLLSNVALKKDEKNEYAGSGGQTFFLWPGSGLIDKKPKWIVAAELVETTRRYARTAARINPNWIEPLAPHLVKRTYSEPRWDGVSGRVLADEKVTLYGLPIVPRRPANFGPIEPATARTLFIQHGLVEGDWESSLPFFKHNRQLVAEINEQLSKTRRTDSLKGEAAHFAFYDERLPAEVFDGPTLARWLKSAGEVAEKRLRLSKADLVKDGNIAEAADFPDDIELGGVRLPLDYHLEPGSDEDGVTVVVPKEAVNQLHPERLGWLVPGLLEEKVVALIRSLPKWIRTAFVPVPQTAKEVVAKLRFGEGNVEQAIATELSRIAGERITPEMFEAARLPNHLRMNVRVVDEAGEALATGRDIPALQQKYAGAAAIAFTRSAASGSWHQDSLTDWIWGDLPESVELKRGESLLKGYPAIVDQRNAVGLRLIDTPERAERDTRIGLRRLFLLANQKAVKAQVDWLPDLDRKLLNLATLRSPGDVRRQLIDLIADRALFGSDSAIPRSEPAYRDRMKLAHNRISIAGQDVNALLQELAERWQPVRLLLDEKHPPQWGGALKDLRSQAEQLFVGDFFVETPWEWLVHTPRYLAAMRMRFDKLAAGGLERDRQLAAKIIPRWQSYLQRVESDAARNMPSPKLTQYRWMLEEYRVSLFAQPLGTTITISEQRLDKAWAKAVKF